VNNRFGKFYVTFALLDSAEEELRDILSLLRFIPTRVEAVYYGSKFEYVGTSPLFDEVAPGFMMPTYEIIVHKADDGELSVTVESYDENEAPKELVF